MISSKRGKTRLNNRKELKNMAKIKAIHHIAIKAKGIEEYRKTIEFYNVLLGMPIVREWGTAEEPASMIDTGAGLLEIFANGNEVPTEGALRHIAFATDNVDECIETVRKAGYEITMEPKEIVIQSNPPYPARIGFCIGPVGESVEFFCEK